jgi:sec-independent protein translocase protein TatA
LSDSYLFLQGIGFTEILLIVLIILLLFGARKLPELARGMGDAVREFRKATKEAPEESSEKRDSK